MIVAALSLLLAAMLPAQAFEDGDFAAAQQGYTTQWQANPGDADALFGLAQLAIYDNRPRDAQKWLSLARSVAPSDPRIAKDERTIALRTDATIDRVGPHAGDDAVPFVTTDPLPSIRVVINGQPATLIIDTGAPNVVLDSAFAQKLGLTVTGSRQGTFAGGMHATVGQSSIANVQIGTWSIADLPASVLPVGNILGTQPVAGIIGAGFFSHFITTLDYVHGELILRDKAQSSRFEQHAAAAGATIVPMWLVGDHFIFVRAHANDGPEALFNIDTGGTFGLQLTKPALNAAHVTLDSDKTATGMGGGGATAFIPFTSSATIGATTQSHLDGIYTPQGDQFGIFPFTVAGTISHGFFRHSALTFDFQAMRLIIEPA